MTIFDKYALNYDKWYSEKKGNFIDKIETDLAFKMLEIKKGMKILDVGCGTGNFSLKLAEAGCKVTGIDISEEMLAIARDKAAKHSFSIDFIKMDVNSLNFADNEFDAVISMAVFEFIDEIKKALEEMLRVVKPDGYVLVGTIAGDSEWAQLYKSKQTMKDTVFKYAKFKTLRDLKELKPSKLLKTEECLYISPHADEAEFNYEKERELTGKRRGGYICALWKK